MRRSAALLKPFPAGSAASPLFQANRHKIKARGERHQIGLNVPNRGLLGEFSQLRQLRGNAPVPALQCRSWEHPASHFLDTTPRQVVVFQKLSNRPSHDVKGQAQGGPGPSTSRSPCQKVAEHHRLILGLRRVLRRRASPAFPGLSREVRRADPLGSPTLPHICGGIPPTAVDRGRTNAAARCSARDPSASGRWRSPITQAAGHSRSTSTRTPSSAEGGR